MNQKPCGRTPMISRGGAIDREPTPDDGRIAAEPPLPVAVAEHHDRGTALLRRRAR